MPYSSGPGMPGPYGAAQQSLRLRPSDLFLVYHIPSLAHSSQYCRISTKKSLLLSSDCQLHFVRLPRIIEA